MADRHKEILIKDILTVDQMQNNKNQTKKTLITVPLISTTLQ